MAAAATRIVMMGSALSAEELAREMVPAGCELVVVKAGTPEFRSALAGADCLVGFGDPAVDDAAYRAAPKLKLFQLLSAGYDRCDIEAARRAGVPICNNGGANSTAVVRARDHADAGGLAAGSLAACERRRRALAGQRPRRGRSFTSCGTRRSASWGWAPSARRWRGWPMPSAWRCTTTTSAGVSEAEEDALSVRFKLLGEMLRASDIVSLHVPLTPASRHMIGAAELALMKPTAYLINTCRGPVVDEAALTAALTDGTIAGAGLDVFDQEPPPADNPLFRLNNVVLTPHFAGPTWDNQQARFRNAFDNCQRVARGEKPLWVIPELAAAG